MHGWAHPHTCVNALYIQTHIHIPQKKERKEKNRDPERFHLLFKKKITSQTQDVLFGHS